MSMIRNALHLHDQDSDHDRHHRRKPGRPRSEAVENAITGATLDLLGEGVSYSDLSVEQIAARAGVGKATIYRRWANKEELVVGSLKTMYDDCVMPDFTDGLSTRERLVRVLEIIREGAIGARSGMLFGTVMAEGMRHPEFARKYQEMAIEPRRDILRAVLRQGIADGDLRADLDIERSLRMLSAPVLMYMKIERPGEDVPEGFLAGLVDDLLRGFSAAGTDRSR